MPGTVAAVAVQAVPAGGVAITKLVALVTLPEACTTLALMLSYVLSSWLACAILPVRSAVVMVVQPASVPLLLRYCPLAPSATYAHAGVALPMMRPPLTGACAAVSLSTEPSRRACGVEAKVAGTPVRSAHRRLDHPASVPLERR